MIDYAMIVHMLVGAGLVMLGMIVPVLMDRWLKR
jgi:hypothetical protein